MSRLGLSRYAAALGAACLVVGCCQHGLAQSPAASGPPVVGTADGGTRETLESIFIPPKPGAPFSLVLETEWARPMFGGGSVTVANRRRIMRDSKGRIYQERWGLVPKNGKLQSTMAWIQIADPDAHTLLNCAVVRKRCDLMPYAGSTQVDYAPFTRPSGPLPSGDGFVQHEELGAGDVGGLPVTGVRETTTVAPGTRGNDQAMVTVREFWYSAQLGVNLRSTFQGPSAGKQTFLATEVTLQEPEDKFFQAPQGFVAVDERQTQPTQQP